MKRVYIIHGWTYSLDKWTAALELLSKNNIEPIMLQVPGLTEDSTQVWDIDGYIQWLNQKIKDVDKPVIIGHSNGGRIALSFVQKYPGRLGQLILIDSAGIATNQKKALLKLTLLRNLSKVGKIFSYLPPVKKLFYKIIGAQDYNNAPPNMKVTMQNMLRADQLVDFSKIKLPVTLIWGRDDSMTPLSDGQTMNQKIVGSDLHIIDNAKHAPFFSHPEAVVSIIMKALNT